MPDDFDSVMQLVYMLALLAFVWFGLRGAQSFGKTVKYLSIYAALILALILGYSYRGEVREAYSRIKAELLPGSPVNSGDGSVTLVRALDGHFNAVAEVNGARISFLVDTGASRVVLPYDEAARAGFSPDSLAFTQAVQTANGTAFAAPVLIDTLAIGDIVLRDVRAMVSEPGRLNVALLGMSFLGRLSGYRVEDDRLTLQE